MPGIAVGAGDALRALPMATVMAMAKANGDDFKGSSMGFFSAVGKRRKALWTTLCAAPHRNSRISNFAMRAKASHG